MLRWKIIIVVVLVYGVVMTTLVDMQSQSPLAGPRPPGISLGNVVFFMTLLFFGLCSAIEESTTRIVAAIESTGRKAEPADPRTKRGEAS